jgi:glutamyl-Q tRNA(Asp) synthetase
VSARNPTPRSSQLSRIDSAADAAQGVGRYAPSTTGLAHPGTLLAALLCWLDARTSGAELELRLEDLDPERCRPEFATGLVEDLRWIGLDWDRTVEQSTRFRAHEEALDALAAAGHLYPCTCSRADIRHDGQRAPDGGFRYSNRCRGRSLPPADRGGWRSCREPLRVALPEGEMTPFDEGGLDLCLDPGICFGDPVVRRRDGAVAYHLASVVDDAISGVTRVVRGHDLATSSATQAALRLRLGFAAPVYRHHMLLLEERDQKLSKFHGSVATPELRRHYAAPELCGQLAYAAGLLESPRNIAPADLLPDFSWDRVSRMDVVTRWTGDSLVFSR